MTELRKAGKDWFWETYAIVIVLVIVIVIVI